VLPASLPRRLLLLLLLATGVVRRQRRRRRLLVLLVLLLVAGPHGAASCGLTWPAHHLLLALRLLQHGLAASRPCLLPLLLLLPCGACAAALTAGRRRE
jgi:hypothetical protein